MKRLFCILLLFAFAWAASARQTEIRYLSGTGPEDTVTWDFWCSDGMNARKWSKIEVPSCWEQQGFGGYTYGRYYIYDRDSEKAWRDYREHDFTEEYGIYRHRFDVPRAWSGRQVKIVFEGVMTDAEVKVNGISAGEVHQGGFYRFSYDISHLLKFGRRNQLEVTVRKQSADASVNAAERRADWWLFGGIYRPVYLEARPQQRIERVAVDARADGTLRTEVHLAGASASDRLELSLEDLSTGAVTGTRTFPLDGASVQTFTSRWDGVKTWDPEHPNRYRLQMRLLASDGTLLHRTEEKIGFRTVEFRPQDGIYLNGVKLLVKGTNRHCFESRTGRSVSKATDLQDARLIKAMNMNAVRSHYPPDVHFLEVCDSLGLLYIDELAGWQNAYSDEAAARLLPEMIARDVNHPCIFLWSNGNEGGWNPSIDRDFARYDPQKRHVIHPWADFDGLDTRHYPTAADNVYRQERGQQVFMMTEFLHGLYDRGQGAGLDGLWAKFRRSPLFAGGFLWAYVDEALLRSDTGKLDTYGPNAPDGIVSADRLPEGSFYTVREVWSPVQVKPFVAGKAFKGDFLVENAFLFSSLTESRMGWKVLSLPTPDMQRTPSCLAAGVVTLPAIGPGETGRAHFDLPASFREGDVLELEAYGAAGDTLCTWTFPIKTAAEYFAAYAPARRNPGAASFSTTADGAYVLSAAGVSARFNPQDGTLTEVRKDGSVLPLRDGPVAVGMQMQLRTADLRMQGDTAVLALKFDGAADTVVWKMTPDGRLGLDALVLNYRTDNQFKGSYLDREVFNLGFSFDFPEETVTSVRYLGKGPYRVWKNRLKGTRYNIWEKAKNNTVTGEYYEPLVYPEFKGYHAGLYWATLLSDGFGPVTVHSETDGLFLRLYTPEEPRDKEGRGNSWPAFPAGDISFLLDIPAVNSQGTDGGSASVKMNKGDEGYHIRLWFDF
ncbi:MAG: beta-galactosidase [Bacteroidales bacterium]|nr:beta-galactosidase [Bacteroidales bacterium]